MQKKEFIIIPNSKRLSSFKVRKFILPLEDYSIGFDTYFTIKEINRMSEIYDIIVIMNKFLHRKIDKFRKIYPLFNEKIKFMVEDIGLTDVIDKNRIILYENHIISNYRAINYLKEIGYNNVVINNDLTINEIKDIFRNTNSNLYYFYTGKNILMYSRRHLVSNFNKYYNKEETNNYKLREIVSNTFLDVKEEDGSVIYYDKIFCASKYLKDLNMNLIINLSNLDPITTKMIIKNYDREELCNLILCDYYFLENEIKYKVGDLK